MKIFFDFEQTEGFEFSEKGQGMIQGIKDFAAQRLKVLETEIDEEGGEIILSIFHDPPGIELKGFSKELIEKIKYSLSDDDFRYHLVKMNLLG